jgi:hypothetical protein
MIEIITYEEFLERLPIDMVNRYQIKLPGKREIYIHTPGHISARLSEQVEWRETESIIQFGTGGWNLILWKKTTISNMIIW